MTDAPPAPSRVGTRARRVALDALVRIDEGGAYANLVLGPLLDRSGLDERDRGLVTELVYGVTRMRRACDHLVDRFLVRPPDPTTRAALRLGAYQLHFLHTAPHAAVSATVGVAPARTRGLVNAILRKVATTPVEWPDEATRLSYPDWLVELVTVGFGDDGLATLIRMNEAPPVTTRADGYTQDLASQWVVEAVEAQVGDLVVDLCAGPGGKATALAATGATVVAADVTTMRAGLVAGNARRVGQTLAVLTADGRHPPLRPGSVDRVLVDAPCSGLGVLGRRPDARWRIQEGDIDRLAQLQLELLDAAVTLLRPGGTLVYSVCTFTVPETIGVDRALAEAHPRLLAFSPPADHPWRPHGRGGLLLPHDAGTDGMAMFRYRLAAG